MTLGLRPARILAVARRERARAAGGRRGLGLLLFSLLLLLPAGAWRLKAPESLPAVAGELPVALEGRLRLDPQAKVQLAAGPPVVVRARAISAELRAALDSLEPRPVLRVQPPLGRVRLPGRALLVALLAISMLTGPLAESLPGEREGRTLELLLASSCSRLELVLGKWLAWTGLSSGVALMAGLAGVLRGTLPLGLWLLALPAALGFVVALGLWLVRGAADLVGGAALPMRVLPLLAVLAVGAALGLGAVHPLLGALVPLGGALALAGEIQPAGAGLALLSSLVGAGLLLWRTAEALDAQGLALPAERTGGGALLLSGLLAHALAAWGPRLFHVQGEPLAPPGLGERASGLLLGLIALVGLARRPERPRLWRWGPQVEVPVGLGLGLLLGGLLEGPGAALGLGSALWLRLALQARLPWPLVGLAHAVVLWPLAPGPGMALGLGLALLHARASLGLALLVHLGLVLL